MRVLALVSLLAALAGCAEPVSVRDPHTGETVLCKTAASEWNPWSQDDACVSGHIAQGWTIVR
jgi:hypothetical protein